MQIELPSVFDAPLMTLKERLLSLKDRFWEATRRFLTLTAREGFLWAALAGFLLASTSLWAITTLPYFQNQTLEPIVLRPTLGPSARSGAPSELAWFFVRFPYLSPRVQIRSKNHHTFLVADSARGREYVVEVGQSYRRVETYFSDNKLRSTVQIFRPGTRRTVLFHGLTVVSDNTQTDANLWMWQSPLWNALHLKIYALADAWLDAPYKRYSCAGFVHEYLGQAGVTVPLLDAWDIARQRWTRVPYDEMEPGDILLIRAGDRQRLFWKHRVTHVAIYLGNGKIIHASTAPHSRRAWVRITGMDTFRHRIDRVVRPPNLL